MTTKDAAQTRSAQIDAFLASAGWASAQRSALAGDASFRKYERVNFNGRIAVLMDAPPEKEDISPFVAVGEYLCNAGLSAPRILARDQQHGFLLLEDLGDDLYSRVLNGKHGLASTPTEKELYLLASDVLVQFHRTRGELPSFLPPYDTVLYMREVALFVDWFLPLAVGKQKAAELSKDFLSMWEDVLARAALPVDCFVHRDYHADNLLYLSEREGISQCGLLDFQDAVLGASAYDMVSFLEDARRDVSAKTVDAVMEHYLQQTNQPKDRFMQDYAVLGAQRNTKIIGIFSRLALRDGKHYYLSLLPRVWGHLSHDVTHPLLSPVRQWLDTHVPASLRGVLTLPEQVRA